MCCGGGWFTKKNKIRGRNKATKNIRKLKKQLQCRHTHSYITVSVVEFTVNELSAPIKSDCAQAAEWGKGRKDQIFADCKKHTHIYNTNIIWRHGLSFFFFVELKSEVTKASQKKWNLQLIFMLLMRGQPSCPSLIWCCCVFYVCGIRKLHKPRGLIIFLIINIWKVYNRNTKPILKLNV